VRAFLTAPARIRLVVVRVETSEPGLYGLGCATFTQRVKPVFVAVNEYLDPFLRGKDPDNIEDLWQAMYQSSYWRNGPVLTNALSGVDMALWDIKGKRAGMPVYQLLGGKCRTAVPVYRHASGTTVEQVAERTKAFMAEGAKYVRIQVAVPGQSTYGARAGEQPPPLDGEGHFAGRTFEPAAYRRILPKLFEHVRKECGEEVELLHDVHERLHPIEAIGVCKEVEKYRPFFIEDPFAPEDIGYFKVLRPQTSVPLAMGELFNNPNEWVDLISNRLIDFIRVHLSQVGGISVGRKIAALADFFRVRSAWHGPGDVCPVGHAANLHLDLAIWNFGVQEATVFNDAAKEVFPGTPEVKDGMFWVNEKPGLGVDFNEELAAKYPITEDPPFDLDWGRLRGKDGTIRRP
jgi:mannonate dehydratase